MLKTLGRFFHHLLVKHSLGHHWLSLCPYAALTGASLATKLLSASDRTNGQSPDQRPLAAAYTWFEFTPR